MQELLCLQSRNPKAVLAATFKICSNRYQLVCAILTFHPLRFQSGKADNLLNPKDSPTIKRILSDVFFDIEFLWERFHSRSIIERLGSESILFIRELDCFFLSNWARLFEADKADNSLDVARQILKQGSNPTSQEMADEIKSLALVVLKMNNIEVSELEKFLQKSHEEPFATLNLTLRKNSSEWFSDSLELQDLIKRMLSSDSGRLLAEIKAEEFGKQISLTHCNEESKTATTEDQSLIMRSSRNFRFISFHYYDNKF